MIIFGVKLWTSPPDDNHPYGHLRIEAIVTAMIGFVLVYIGIKICYEAIFTIGKDHALPTWIATVGPLLTIGIKTWLYKYTISFGKKIKSSAVVANANHQLSDVISSLPALIGSVVPVFFPSLVIIDHIGAVIVALFIFHFAFGIIKPAVLELTDVGMRNKKRKKILTLISNVPGVQFIENLRSRKMGNGYFVDLTILVNEALSIKEGHDIAENAKNAVTKKFPSVKDIVVHVEPFFKDQLVKDIKQKMSSVDKSFEDDN